MREKICTQRREGAIKQLHNCFCCIHLHNVVLIELKPCRLNLAFYIAKRVAFNRQKSFSRFIIRLSVTATALSVMAMILTLAFVNGFQQTVSEKVFSFWGHVRVQNYEPNKSLVAEETVIRKNSNIEALLRSEPGVQQVQSFATIGS